jgi:HEAT repeat protein
MVSTFASADRPEIERLIARMQVHVFPEYEGLLVANLAHADRGVREWSAHALGDLGFTSSGTIGALIHAFGDKDDWVRWKAVRALGLIGPPAKRALPMIEPVANAEQEVEVVRAAAKVAIQRIRGQ